MTGIMSRHVVTIGAVFLVICGLIPKIGAVIASMPLPVLGGGVIVMFGMVAAAGLNVLSEVTLNRRNMVIIAVSLAVGLGLNLVPSAVQYLPGVVKVLATSAVAPTAVACSCVRRFPCLARRMCQRPPLTPACLGAMPFAHCQCEIRGTFTCATKLHAPRVLLQIDSLTDCQAASIRPSAHRPQPGGTKRFVTCRRRKQTLLPANPDVVLPRRDIRHIESLSLAKSKSSR